MIALLAFGLAAGSAGATPSTYPAAAVVDAFKGLCGNPASIDAIRAAARDNGWAEFIPAPSSDLGKILANGKAMASQIAPKDAKMQLSAFVAFRKTVAGRDIEATTDAATIAASGKTITATGCQIYDFTARAMPDDGALTAWAGRAPDKKIDTGQISMSSWDNGLARPISKLTIAYTPATSPLADPARMVMLGLSIKSQQFTVTQ
ncbi:hypothetical protein [Sphingomonas asaccharolytica]|uniref:hypothetical protein n=1 Tax=Sphingomonas asaccharolytica TaxID=40681 RepID=UPI00082A35C9|nr:hypothetical protein [Sphingomonas asaccharolytica]